MVGCRWMRSEALRLALQQMSSSFADSKRRKDGAARGLGTEEREDGFTESGMRSHTTLYSGFLPTRVHKYQTIIGGDKRPASSLMRAVAPGRYQSGAYTICNADAFAGYARRACARASEDARTRGVGNLMEGKECAHVAPVGKSAHAPARSRHSRSIS